MVGRGAVDRNVRPGRIVRDHAAERGARAGRDIRSETKAVRPQERVELIEHNAGADAHRTIIDIQIEDLAVVT